MTIRGVFNGDCLGIKSVPSHTRKLTIIGNFSAVATGTKVQPSAGSIPPTAPCLLTALRQREAWQTGVGHSRKF